MFTNIFCFFKTVLNSGVKSFKENLKNLGYYIYYAMLFSYETSCMHIYICMYSHELEYIFVTYSVLNSVSGLNDISATCLVMKCRMLLFLFLNSKV